MRSGGFRHCFVSGRHASGKARVHFTGSAHQPDVAQVTLARTMPHSLCTITSLRCVTAKELKDMHDPCRERNTNECLLRLAEVQARVSQRNSQPTPNNRLPPTAHVSPTFVSKVGKVSSFLHRTAVRALQNSISVCQRSVPVRQHVCCH